MSLWIQENELHGVHILRDKTDECMNFNIIFLVKNMLGIYKLEKASIFYAQWKYHFLILTSRKPRVHFHANRVGDLINFCD